MINVQIRKQGGAAIMTIPSDLLKMLKLTAGDTVAMSVKHGELIAQPVRKEKHKRYTLAELLKGTDRKTIKALNKETAWAREGKAIGREEA